jgi:hypothetical protein
MLCVVIQVPQLSTGHKGATVFCKSQRCDVINATAAIGVDSAVAPSCSSAAWWWVPQFAVVLYIGLAPAVAAARLSTGVSWAAFVVGCSHVAFTNSAHAQAAARVPLLMRKQAAMLVVVALYTCGNRFVPGSYWSVSCHFVHLGCGWLRKMVLVVLCCPACEPSQECVASDAFLRVVCHTVVNSTD